MRLFSKSLAIMCAILFLFGAIGASAADTITYGPLITGTAVPNDPGQFSLQLTNGFFFHSDYFNDNGNRVSSGGHFFSFQQQLQGTYGFFRGFQMSLTLPWSYNTADIQGISGSHAGMGDVQLGAKYQFLTETDCNPAMATTFRVGFPTGNGRHLELLNIGTDMHGNGAYAFAPGIVAQKDVGPFILYSNVEYQATTKSDASIFVGDWEIGKINRNLSDRVNMNVAAEYPIKNSHWVLFGEINTWVETGSRIFSGCVASNDNAYAVNILPGVQYNPSKDWRIAVGYTVPIFGASTDVIHGPIVGVTHFF